MIRGGANTRFSQLYDLPSVSCADRPLDLRPVADALEQTIRDMCKDGPVIVVIGKEHVLPTHVVLPQVIAEPLTTGPDPLRVAMGIERPADLYDYMLHEKYGDKLPPGLAPEDLDGQNMLELYRETQMVNGAPATRRNVLEFFREHHLPVRAVDGRTDDDLGGHHGNTLIGLGRRNFRVVDNVAKHFEETGADVYVLPYGGAHFVGMKERTGEDYPVLPYPAEESLVKLFQDRGYNVLPVMAESPGFNLNRISPVGAQLLKKRSIVLEGMSHEPYWRRDDATREANSQLWTREREFLQRMSRSSGGLLTVYPDHEVSAQPTPQAPEA